MEKTLQEQLTEVETLLEQEKGKGVQKDADTIARLEKQQADLLLQMDGEKARLEQEAAQNVRIQAQEEKVATITLPYNFNDIFSDEDYKNAQGQPHKITVANDMIIELVQEYKRKDYEEHNTEIQTLTDAHKEELRLAKEEIRAAGERELQLKHQNDGLQTKIDAETKQAQADAIEHANLLQQIAQLQLEKQDADSKRDAAVKQLEEAQAEIVQLKGWNDDLRAQAAVGVRKAIDIIDISPSDKLALMVKETNEQKANRGLARWSEMMPEVVAPPVVPAGTAVFHTDQANVPTDHLDQAQPIPIPADHQEVAAPALQFQGEVQVDPGLSSANGKSGETVSRQEFETLKGRVEQIERQAGIRVA